MSQAVTSGRSRRLVFYETEVRFVVVLLVVFLLLLNQIFWSVTNRYKRTLEQEVQGDLEKIAELVRDRLLLAIPPTAAGLAGHAADVNDSLASLSRMDLAYQTIVVDRGGQVLAPSGRMKLNQSPVIGLSATEWTKLSDGEPLLTWNFEKTGQAVTIATPILMNGDIAGAVIIKRDIGKIAFLDRLTGLLSTARIVSIVAAILFSVSYVRFVMLPFRIIRQKAVTFLQQRDDAGELESAGSGVQFVIDTFERTIGELEEKERLLKELYAKATDRVHEVERYNEFVLENISCGVITLDAGGIITSINRYALDLLRIPLDAFLHRDHREVFKTGHPIGQEFHTRMNGGPERVVDWILPVAGPGDRILELSSSLLKDDQGLVLGVIFVFTDQTEHRHMLDRIRQKHHLETIGEMSAGIAHEIRNPLGAMAGFLNLLDRHREQPERISAYLQELRENIGRLDGIVRDFLNFARPALPRIAEVNLRELLETLGDSLIRARYPGVEIKVSFSGESLIEGDSALLSQAFTNLIANAAEAMEGEGAINIHGTGIDTVPPCIRIDFTDTGPGIEHGHAQKVFQPFFTTKATGSGLGLAIVQRIIVNHNGDITLQPDTDGRGAHFKVILPRYFSMEQTARWTV
ncbi:PAS domain-containing protein [bacterium]|nr:PAS domain-containing protein [candidate division CSSED10-310 bacterium]